MPDAHKNFSYSTVAAAPSPASSGVSLTVQAGGGALFPAVPFNATVWPRGVAPLASNAEVVRVTAGPPGGDVFTIVRAQEGSSARAIGVGDQIAATITAKTLTDVEDGLAALVVNVLDRGVKGDVVTITDAAIASGAAALSSPGTPFTQAHVGMRVQVVGAGAAYNNRGAWDPAATYAAYDLVTYNGVTYVAAGAISAKAVFAVEGWSLNPANSMTLIAAISSVSGGVATLDTNASTTVTGATCVYGTDDTAAMLALGAGDFFFPGVRTYFLADWYIQSHTNVYFGPGAVFKMPYYKTTNVAPFRLMTASPSTSYLEDIHFHGLLTIDMTELTIPATNTVPRGVMALNCQDWSIESLKGVGLPGATGNVLQVGANSLGAQARRFTVGPIFNSNVRGIGSSCVQHTAGSQCVYERVSCDGGVALRIEMDAQPGTSEDVHCLEAYANGDSGFPCAAFYTVAHDNTIRNILVDSVQAEGGADGWVPNYNIGTGSVSGVTINRMRVTGGGSGTRIGGNDFAFPGCIIRDAYVSGASLTSLHSVVGSNPGVGYQVAAGMTLVNPRAVLCAGRGFYDIFMTAGVAVGSLITLINPEATSNVGPGSEFRFPERVLIVGGNLGDVPAYATPSNAQKLPSNAYTGTLAGWSAAAGASGVSGAAAVLTVTANGTSTGAVGRTATGVSGVAVTPGHFYQMVADAALGTAPSGANAVASLWFYKSDGSAATNGIQNGSTPAPVTTGTTHVAFAFTAPSDAAFVTAIVKFFSNTVGQTLTNGWTMTFTNLALQELVGIPTQTYGVFAGTGVTVELFGVNTLYNGVAGTGGTGTITDHSIATATQAALTAEAVTRAAADATLQPLDSDLTAIAALTTTSFGRALLALADAAAMRTAAGLGTAATSAATAFDTAGAAAAAQAASQPLDSDLTAIAALSTTSFGQSLLALANAAALRTAAGLGTAAVNNTGDFDAAGAAAAAQAASQPVDSDLTAIAALSTTSFGRSLLALADAPAMRTAAGTVIGTDVAAQTHATQHKSGGSDAIKLDELAAPTDVTTLNATTALHGLLKKLDNNAVHYMDGTGAWSRPKSRYDVGLVAEGLITETYPRELINGSTIMIDGTAYFMKVTLLAGEVVANLAVVVATLGATVTLSKVGLYSKAGSRLAVSADQGTAWQTTGIKNPAMISPYTVPTDDGYYVAVISKASTLPFVASATKLAAASGAIGSGMGAYGVQTGQTDLPTNATIIFSGSPIAVWEGVS